MEPDMTVKVRKPAIFRPTRATARRATAKVAIVLSLDRQSLRRLRFVAGVSSFSTVAVREADGSEIDSVLTSNFCTGLSERIKETCG